MLYKCLSMEKSTCRPALLTVAQCNVMLVMRGSMDGKLPSQNEHKLPKVLQLTCMLQESLALATFLACV
jgi:hypothetical protein